jgi:Capsule assembly protein Wzi
MISAGWSRAQVDIGYRDHWWSPMTDSAMLISTEAPTMPSITLSNYAPLTSLGIEYELFFARMSNSDHIEFNNGFTSGRPELSGLHLAIEPVNGWSLGLNRLLQFGGGARGGQSISEIFRGFINPGRFDNANPNLTTNQELGNQVASVTSSFLFQGKTPFAVYFEYAGEDTSRGRSYLLGNAALSGGLHFPKLWHRFELTYEVSEWQDGWYVHHIYQDGLTNDGDVIGNWFGDQRRFNDGVGGQSHMLRLGWDPSFGGKYDLRVRTVENASYSGGDYRRGYDATVSYSRPWQQLIVGGEVFAGRDVFGSKFSRVSGFVRFGDHQESGAAASDSTDESERVSDDSAQLFVDAGVNANKVLIDLSDTLPRETTNVNIAPHFALGARRAVSDRQDLGARVEFDQINGHLLISARAVDYRFRFHGPLAAGFFLGAARYDLATPAYGMYWGFGTQWRDFLVRGWDLGLDYRDAVKVARDHLLPTDPGGTRPDSFYDITGLSLYVSHRF